MNILVRGTNWIGDAVMTVPALRELRRIFPDSRITYHTRAWAEGLFRDCDFIDEIISYKKSGSAVKDVFTQARRLRSDTFGLGILLPNSFETALTQRLAHVTRRYGYESEKRGVLLTHAIPIPEWKGLRHEAYYYLNLISEVEKSELGRDTIDPANISGRLDISNERRADARALLGGFGFNLTKPTIALGVGSTNSRAKRWPAERFAALNDKLAGELAANVILIGSKNEIPVAREVERLSRIKPLILAGKTDIAEAAAILSEIDLLISNDMGLAHVAPAVGTKTIVIFGPTNPETTRPFSDAATVIRKQVECSPCMLRDCPIDHRCMTGISVEQIFETAAEKLNMRQPVSLSPQN